MVCDTNVDYFFLQNKFFMHKSSKNNLFSPFASPSKVYFLQNIT